MIKMSLYGRCSFKNISSQYFRFLQLQLMSSKSSDKNDQQDVNDKKKNNTEALEKLNLLLRQIVEDDAVSKRSTLELAKPKPKKQFVQEHDTENVTTDIVEKEVVDSVKNVAKSLGENAKQIESELLSKLLNPVDIDTTNKQATSMNLSDIVKGMKIDRSKKSNEDLSRAQQVRNILQATKGVKDTESTQLKVYRKPLKDTQFVDHRFREKINLFGKESLGIFSNISQFTENEINKTWQKLHNRDLKLAITHPPSNYFQQMILWTEQGKLWKFPIDNEQGMEEEQNVYFTEHVFLEKHLDPWCPTKGPIRHFMELVCVGLSKNPYMSVKRKQEHIAWYRDYFQDKHKLLEEIGAIPQDTKQKNQEVIQDSQN